MLKMVFAAVLLCSFFTGITQKKVPVFVSGTDGHKSYRIPAIVGNDKTLFAFCEGRVDGSGDFGDINLVMKRSIDGGLTWSALQTIVDADSLQAGNPAPVIDLTDPAYPGGRIFLFYNTGNNHEGEVRKGAGLREVWYKTSTDKGNTWSKAVNITTQVHRPKQVKANPAYNFKEDWRSYANTPGHAMQFQHGRFRGRIFIAANHSAGDPQPGASDYAAHGYFTSDHGKSFQISETVNVPGSNESTATELEGDRLMMNSRNQKGDIRARLVSISKDGGKTWDSTWFDRTLIDPVNQGSLLTIAPKMIAFCNAADEKRRDNLTLRISDDDGLSWKKQFLIEKSADGTSRDFTAYSDLVTLSKNSIGVLYERDAYKEIVFTAVKWK